MPPAGRAKIFDHEDAEDLSARGAQRPQQDAFLEALVTAGKQRAHQHQQTGQHREHRHKADHKRDLAENRVERLEDERQIDG